MIINFFYNTKIVSHKFLMQKKNYTYIHFTLRLSKECFLSFLPSSHKTSLLLLLMLKRKAPFESFQVALGQRAKRVKRVTQQLSHSSLSLFFHMSVCVFLTILYSQLQCLVSRLWNKNFGIDRKEGTLTVCRE
jgi:hypothetical protein